MNEILSYIVGKVADRVPSFILSRILPPRKVAEQVKVKLRGENPICPNLNSANPQIDLWLEITNLSNLKLVLDRVLVDVWFCQPTFNGSILRRRDVPARGIVTDILYQQTLTIAQKEQIESCLSEKGPNPYLSDCVFRIEGWKD